MEAATSSRRSSATAYSRPRTRQRVHKAPPTLEVPDIEENASERKRVLNVLAQRRYRERRRQDRVAKQKQGDSEGQPDGAGSDSLTPTVPGAANLVDQTTDDLLPFTDDGKDANAVGFSLDAATAWTTEPSDGLAMSEFIFGTMNTSILDQSPTSATTMLNLSSSPSTVDPASVMNSSASPSSSLSEFSDTYLLPMNDLQLLKGVLQVATRLGCSSDMWNPAANSPFNEGAGTPAELLPETWKPTTAQILTPHHPLMDFLPWPDVRTRVISLFSLPDAMRPPTARGPLGLVNFAYDLEDTSEGVRIWGADPCDASNWEVGQTFFQRWWFVFDRSVIEQSNKWRRLRGAAALQLMPGSVSPVVDDV
ncbi:uncharacterized protein CTRU02_212091 [Colletotrichum truncatum]|uniref:Uncharacterized protein n=1 Tax=Colletotrichum truncatum TaxID=5467 RepID=A0ACC3YML4_COLTU|nr:uncharacterized protein CTRU02_06838 [Colletotrichum truncatum]KAF6792221.1 hypothetical protein CTRU02_06838 [Colletotrichum truncatum]